MGIALLAGFATASHAEDTTTPAATKPAENAPKVPKRYDVWVVDCLEKVFQDQEMPKDAAKDITIHAAQGEFEAAQIAVRPKDDSVGGLRAIASPLKQSGSDATLPAPKVRYVDSVPIGKNSWQTPPEDLIVKAPALIPDVLYDVDYVPAWQDRTRSIWITFDIALNAKPGVYRGEVKVFVNDENVTVPVTVQVHNVAVPAKRSLKVTNWVYLDAMARWNGCEFFDDRFWELAKRYAENMASHRQNMIMTPLYRFYGAAHLVDFSVAGDKLAFDFTNFDRWVNIFLEAGFTYIEGSHLGWIDGNVFCYDIKDGKIVQADHLATSPEAEHFLSQFLPALQQHLEQKGWLDIYYQHMRDEPSDEQKALYDKLMDLRRAYAPRIKTIEATHSTEIEPPTIMVPLLSHLAEKYDQYKAKQDKGQEVWFYAACGPNGSYANRFLDYHLLKVRYAHWLNFKYNIPGYLHWGYNFWGMLSPYSEIHMTWAVGPLPPGDSYIVYPTPKGVLDSIRWETMRDGIEDYELLRLLEIKNPSEAARLCASLISGFDKYDMDVKHFRAVRLELLNALEK
jgi:phosphatidylserine decarboxylase